MSSMTGVMISARRRSIAVLAIRSLLIGLSGTKKRARGPSYLSGGACRFGPGGAAVKEPYTPHAPSLQERAAMNRHSHHRFLTHWPAPRRTPTEYRHETERPFRSNQSVKLLAPDGSSP